MRILFEAGKLEEHKTGVGYYAEYLANKLADHPKVQLTLGSYRGCRVHTTTDAKVKKSLLPRKLIYKLLAYRIRIPFQALWGRGWDAAIFPDFNSLSAFGANAKTVVVVHDLEFLLNEETLEQKHGKILNKILPAGSRYLQKTVPPSIAKANIVIVSSRSLAKDIDKYFTIHQDKLMVIGIPPADDYVPDKTVKPPYDLTRRKFIYYQATIEPRKNHLTLLSAYEKLPNNIQQEYPLVLGGGSGWKEQEVIGKIEQLQKQGLSIIQLGYVSQAEKTQLYQTAALYVQPSLREGFGMPILEAMACATPVAASDIPIFREIAEETIAYFDPKDSKDIATTIEANLKINNARTQQALKQANSFRKDKKTIDLLVSRLK